MARDTLVEKTFGRGQYGANVWKVGKVQLCILCCCLEGLDRGDHAVNAEFCGDGSGEQADTTVEVEVVCGFVEACLGDGLVHGGGQNVSGLAVNLPEAAAGDSESAAAGSLNQTLVALHLFVHRILNVAGVRRSDFNLANAAPIF